MAESVSVLSVLESLDGAAVQQEIKSIEGQIAAMRYQLQALQQLLKLTRIKSQGAPLPKQRAARKAKEVDSTDGSGDTTDAATESPRGPRRETAERAEMIVKCIKENGPLKTVELTRQLRLDYGTLHAILTAHGKLYGLRKRPDDCWEVAQ